MPLPTPGNFGLLSRPNSPPETLQAVILGSDLILAALPSEPVQVVNSCLAMGYDIVVPASWGDELIAGGVLDELAMRPSGTAILCSCPHARNRMFSAGSELSPFILSTITPPVAAARYLRALNSERPLHITYFGACPGVDDHSINERVLPQQFLELCEARGVIIAEQPKVFESFIPMDRRRHFSLPGGLPTSQAIRSVHPGTDVLHVDAISVAFDVAQCVISGRTALLDMAPAVGCACSGFAGESILSDARETLLALEPPRSATPVVDSRIAIDIDLPSHNHSTVAFEEIIPLNVVVGADLSLAGSRERNAEEDAGAPCQSDYRDSGETTREPGPSDHSALLAEAARDPDISWEESSFDFDHVDGRAGLHTTSVPPRADANTSAPRSPSREPSREAPHEPEQSDQATAPQVDLVTPRQRRSGTPTGAPAIRTPAGPLPRAYLMLRRIKASGEHAALTDQSGAAQRSPGDPDRQQQGAPPATSAPAAAPETTTAQTPTPSAPGVPSTVPAPAARAVTHDNATRSQPTGHDSTKGTVDTVLDILTKAIRDVVEHR